MTTGPIKLELTRAEAIVFADWLRRFNQATNKHIEDQAEERVLWDLEATLEAVLVEPFDPNYADLLAGARAAVRDAS